MYNRPNPSEKIGTGSVCVCVGGGGGRGGEEKGGGYECTKASVNRT